jgi:guanylate kinase
VSRGRLIVVAGPSGVGKGTVVRRLLVRDPERLVHSVSATTRPARRDERDGIDYRFVDDESFTRMVEEGAFLEWAEVFRGSRYGTPRASVDPHRAAGRDVVLEIDVQGAAQVREREPEAVLILLEPPSLEDLERRLRGRGSETEDSIAERLEAAERELAQAAWFDHRVVNDDLDRAVAEVAAIIERSRTTPDQA